MRTTNQRLLLAVAVLAVLNFLMSGLTVGDAESLDGHIVEAHSSEARWAAFNTLFFHIQLICFLLALPLAAIPFRGRPYGQKLLTLGLVLAAGVQGLLFVLGVAKIIGLWG
jgi:hypothetical protein